LAIAFLIPLLRRGRLEGAKPIPEELRLGESKRGEASLKNPLPLSLPGEGD